MFPTEIPTVLFMIGLLIVSVISNKGIIYTLTGFVILFMNFHDTTNSSETILMALFSIVFIYYGLNARDAY